MNKEPIPNESENPQPQKVKYEIPVEGSLGLLALGHVGLKLWREKRQQVAMERRAQQQKTNNKSK